MIVLYDFLPQNEILQLLCMKRFAYTWNDVNICFLLLREIEETSSFNREKRGNAKRLSSSSLTFCQQIDCCTWKTEINITQRRETNVREQSCTLPHATNRVYLQAIWLYKISSSFTKFTCYREQAKSYSTAPPPLNFLLIATDCIWRSDEKPSASLFDESFARENYAEIIATINSFLYQSKRLFMDEASSRP